MYEVFKKLQSNIRSLFIQVHTRLQKLPKDPGQDNFVAMNAQHVRCLQITLDQRDLCISFETAVRKTVNSIAILHR